MSEKKDGRPDPLVPPEVDLRGMEFMPLYGDRLIKSNTWIAASPEAKVAALRLWWHAFGHEVPAASLPDNEQLLADYAGYGVAIKVWAKIKPQAMRGWVLCNDGRWYHRMVAELALSAWERRVKEREKKRAWRDGRNRDKGGDGTGTSPGRPPGQGGGQNRDVPGVSTVESERRAKGEGEESKQSSSSHGLPTGETGTPAGESLAAAAGKKLLYPEKLSAAETEEARKALNGTPRAQLLLDELDGAMLKRRIENPIALLVTFVGQEAIGKFTPSQGTLRRQVEREEAQAKAELEAAGRSATGERQPA